MYLVMVKYFGEPPAAYPFVRDRATAIKQGRDAARLMDGDTFPAGRNDPVTESEVRELFVFDTECEDSLTDPTNEEDDLICDWNCIAAWDCEGLTAWVRVLEVQELN